MSRDPYQGPKPTPLRRNAVAPVVEEPRLRDDEPTLVRCPTCAAFDTPKLGCRLCMGSGYITFEQYRALTVRCPTCVGSGRITKDQSDALDDDAKRRDNE